DVDPRRHHQPAFTGCRRLCSGSRQSAFHCPRNRRKTLSAMIWLLTILLPLLAAVLTPFWPTAKRGAGWVFAAAAVPALWLGLVEVSGITLPWLFLGADFSLDSARRIILLLTAI